MIERDQLVWTCLENPDDPVPRLILADWDMDHDRLDSQDFLRRGMSTCKACRYWQQGISEPGQGIPWIWANESARRLWTKDGLLCFVHRGGGNAWCGYVGVPDGFWGEHGYYDLRIDELNDLVGVHGGWNYRVDYLLCKDAFDMPSGKRWWYGFDCGHGGVDVRPSEAFGLSVGDDYWRREHIDSILAEHPVREVPLSSPPPMDLLPWERYRTYDYVIAEVERAASEIARL